MMRILLFCALAALFSIGEASSPASNSMVVRLRLPDGSMEKIQVNEEDDSLTLQDILQPFDVSDDSKIRVGTSTIDDSSSNLKDLGVKHGTLITIMPKITQKKPQESRFSKLATQPKEWNPYPDLAKDYERALLKTKTRRNAKSYGDLAGLHSELHVVEPQKEGPLQRIYMCRKSAERFHSNGMVKGKSSCRVGLLLGTLQKERVDLKPRKARTSLSSTTSDSEYCQVAKVQALWEPPGQQSSSSDKLYDASKAQALLSKYPRVLKIAKHLNIQPIGWIFSYQDDRLDENKKDYEPQALLGMDVATGGVLQIDNMQKDAVVNGKNRFVTLAMDARTGATEAFQLSDVTVQMVHEGMFPTLVPAANNNNNKNPQTIPTRHAVLVDGRETTKLESVLCLINTAMLSNVGNYAGKTSASSVKKSNGSLNNKAKKAIVTALNGKENRLLMEELCDFTVLMALDQSLSESDMERLCDCVRKFARGQKDGTVLDSKLKMKLKSILGS